MTKDVDEVLAIVREGKGEMPQISRTEITDQQVAQVVQYLKSIVPAQPKATGVDMINRRSPAAVRRPK